MAGVADELSRIEQGVSAIAAAVESKGVAVPSGTPVDGLAALVGEIDIDPAAAWPAGAVLLARSGLNPAQELGGSWLLADESHLFAGVSMYVRLEDA